MLTASCFCRADAAVFDTELRNVVKAVWKDMDQDAVFAAPLIFTNFAAQVSAEPAYLPLPAGEAGMEQLSKVRSWSNRLLELSAEAELCRD